jgi:hypothetical protein
MLKSLRIAVTAVSLTACVLLVALWVRSMSMLDEFHVTTASRINRAYSLHGELKFVSETDTFPGKLVKSWGVWSEKFETEVILPPMPEYASLGFSLTADKYVLAIGVPIWFPVLLSAMSRCRVKRAFPSAAR